MADLSTVLTVNVVTPKGVALESYTTDAITAPGELGEFEILPGHVPFLSALHAGVLVLGESSERRIFAVNRGFLRIDRSGAVEILVEHAIAAANIDTEAAGKDRRDAEEAIAKHPNQPLDGVRKTRKDELDWAQARLDAHARG